MGFFDFFNPFKGKGGALKMGDPGLRKVIDGQLLTGGKNDSPFDKPYKLNATPAPVASLHGWTGSSLGAYIRSFQGLGGPAPGNQIATNQQLFNPALATMSPELQATANSNPAEFLKNQTQAPGSAGVVPSLISNSVGGTMSSAAAALYGRMLGAAPPHVVSRWQFGHRPKPAPTASPYVPQEPLGSPLKFSSAQQKTADAVFGNNTNQVTL